MNDLRPEVLASEDVLLFGFLQSLFVLSESGFMLRLDLEYFLR